MTADMKTEQPVEGEVQTIQTKAKKPIKWMAASTAYVPPNLRDRVMGRIHRNITVLVDPLATRSRREDIDAGRYSSRCTYRKIVHRVTYAMGLRIVGRTIILRIEEDESRRVTLPKGWGWRIEDGYAVLFRCENPDCDYHLSLKEFLSKPRDLVRLAVTNFVRRERDKRARELEQQAALLRSEDRRREEELLLRIAQRCKVTRQDSIGAGNCPVGTDLWAQQHGITTEQLSDPYAGVSAEVAFRCGGRARVAAMRAIDRQATVQI